ncbi:hypothetical protein B0A49_10935 [Cryomyces minteri]|nr:hypothetical protein B0A49_10935 [Cryomyces minteri]
MWDDGVVKPHPPVLRALREVVGKLHGVKGVEMVDWKPYKHDLGWEIVAGLYFGDGAAEETQAIDASGEPWRPLSNFIIKENPHLKHHSIADVWRKTLERDVYRMEYARVWNETGDIDEETDEFTGEGCVDAILCPVGPGAAPPLDCARCWGYTSQWNVLNYPALVFPVTKCDPEVDVREEGYTPRNKDDEFNYELYEPEKYRDAPVSLQLVGRRYEEEKIIEALEFIKERTGLPFVKFV